MASEGSTGLFIREGSKNAAPGDVMSGFGPLGPSWPPADGPNEAKVPAACALLSKMQFTLLSTLRIASLLWFFLLQH